MPPGAVAVLFLPCPAAEYVDYFRAMALFTMNSGDLP
jgi:hypothetical protein